MLVKKFFEYNRKLMDDVIRDEMDTIYEAADMIADAVEKGHNFFIHDRGHLIGGELLGRAGGPVFVRRLDIQIPDPTLTNAHTGSRVASRDKFSPQEKTERRHKFEREYVAYAFEQNGLGKGDVLLLNSNSGYGFSAGVIAETAKEKGVKLIVMTSKLTGEKIVPEGGNKKIAEYADILFDNHAPFGDAVFELDGLDEKLWPASGMGAAYIGWPLVLAVVEKLLERGVSPTVFRSANVEGGADQNARASARYEEMGY